MNSSSSSVRLDGELVRLTKMAGQVPRLNGDVIVGGIHE